MMDRERFHNEFAMRLGYNRIVNDKLIMIHVEESEDPWITLTINGHKDIRFNPSEEIVSCDFSGCPEIQDEICTIYDAAHQAYIMAHKTLF